MRAVSIDFDERAQLAEARIAYAAHQQKVLRAPERAVALAVLNDACGKCGADTRQTLKLLARSPVDVDT